MVCALVWLLPYFWFTAHRSNFGEIGVAPIYTILSDKIAPPMRCIGVAILVEMMGIEPMTPCLQGRCSPS